MKQTDPQYKLRLPQELKDRIEEAAKSTGRSMNAEIVARLEESFALVPNPESAAYLIDQLMAGLENRSLMLSMRFDMVKLRQENLINQIHRISAESTLIAKEAKSDDDFDRSRRKIEELDPLEEQANQLQLEAEQIIRERDALLEQIAGMRKAVVDGQKKREAQLMQNRNMAA